MSSRALPCGNANGSSNAVSAAPATVCLTNGSSRGGFGAYVYAAAAAEPFCRVSAAGWPSALLFVVGRSGALRRSERGRNTVVDKTQWTFVDTDHHQFVVGTRDADTLAVRQSGALLEAGPEFANVLTGTAYGPVEVELAVLASEPDTSEITEWEVIEEAPLRVDSSAYILTMDGEQVEGFSAIPPGRYRIRAHARGRDSGWDRQVTVPVEQHMIWVWPDTSRRGLRQLRKIDNAWDESAQDLTPDLGTVVFIDPDGTVRKVDPTSDEVRQAHAARVLWDGREPSEKLRTRHVSQNVSRIDRRMLDVFESADA